MSRGFQQRRSCKYIRVFFFRLHGCNYGRWMTTVYKLPSAAFAVQFVMKRRRRSSNACTSSRATLFFFCALAIVVAATNCQRCSTSKSLRFGDKRSQSAFVISRPALSRHQRHRSGRSTDATRSFSSGADSSADGAVLNGTMVHDDAWYLGDGGFAAKHLEDEDRISAKKREEDFFRERSLSVYDQMREASMLLLAQQQILAAEEAREEASRPRFVAAATGGSAGARAQAIRDRQKKLGAAAGSLPSPTPPRPTSAPAGERGGMAAGASAVVVPTDPATLSCQSLGVGGLEEELEEIRRRVCVPLAAPVHLLEDLGISPVRGLLLHGPPGCGKTLLARRLSAALTSRPPTVVSGPEILERFVGSSEANVRALFDYPPEVPGGGEEEQAGALHVIVLDEFDSIGQRRGAEGSGNDGGDRVRDSVVNQLLARMDGFQELERPTLLVALTNRIDLLDGALLRPGRFEVQIEIPGPNQAGREEIIRIHTQRMSEANRIDTPATAGATGSGREYDELVSSLAAVTNGFTGAELAGLVRAAASYALERAVRGGDRAKAARDCKVTAEDFGRGLADVTRSKTSAGLPMKGPNTLTRRAPASTGDPPVRDTRSTIESMGGSQAKGDRQRGAEDIGADGVATGTVARLDDGIDGSLSPEDLAAVQKLLQQKVNSQKDQEDDLLLDAAQIVAQRRRSRARSTGRNVGGGDGKGQGSHRGKNTEAKKSDEGKEGESSTPKRPTLKKFEHTGWFHTYE